MSVQESINSASYWSVPPSLDIANDGTMVNYSSRADTNSDMEEHGPPLIVPADIQLLLKNVPAIDRLFHVLEKVGEGTFSFVYKALLKNQLYCGEAYALKHLNPTSHPRRVESELRCLKDLGGSSNIMGVKFCTRHEDHVVFVMPFFAHDKFSDYVRDVTVGEVRDYMKNLFIALERVHQHNIIHRDIKPSNFLYNRRARTYALVDFGLAESKSPNKSSENKLPPNAVKRKNEDTSMNEGQRKRSALAPLVVNDTINKQCPAELITSPGFTKLTPCSKVAQPNITLKTGIIFPQPPLAKTKAGLAGTSLTLEQWKSRDKTAPRKLQPNTKGVCRCYGLPRVCDKCLSRKQQFAQRAGTPGFRAPEVLLKHPQQTTAVDMWSTGVILLCFLSGRYPFFRAPDDLTALAEIITLFGTESLKGTSMKLGKLLTCQPERMAIDLRKLCRRLRSGPTPSNTFSAKCANCLQLLLDDGCLCKGQRSAPSGDYDDFPDHAFDLLEKLLDLNHDTRITAAQALRHPFFAPS